MQNTKFRRLIGRRNVMGAIPALLVTGLAMPHVARATTRIARFGHGNPDDSQIGQGALAFAAAVAADPVIGGAVTIEVYNNAQLGDDVSALKSCMKGTLDGALIGSSIMAGIVSEVGIINAPYLFRDAAQARAALDGPIGVALMDASRARRLPVLAWGENGVRQLTSNVPVRTVADLHGLKIRVPPAAIFVDGFRALGAAPAPLAFGLLKDALHSGEFTAEENAISTVQAAKLYEVQKYLCLTSHIYDAVGFIASPDLMEDLTEPQRVALADCARKGAAMSRRVAEEGARDGVAKLKAAGMTVIDDVDLAGFRAAARPYLESLSNTYGKDRVAALLAAGA
jgi:tripartite ATP-independent transporter DctP family solute receptor